MDRSLLQLFVNSVRDRLSGRHIGAIRWYRPVLSLHVRDRDRGLFLVAILETPGPFCFFSDDNPLRGLAAPTMFSELSGVAISDIRLLESDRVVQIDTAGPAGPAGGKLRFFYHLYGSYGRAELMRDENLLHRVGGRAPSSPRTAPDGAKTGFSQNRALDYGSGFYLLSNGRLGRVVPASSDDETAVHRFGPFDDVVEGCREVGIALLAGTYERMIEKRLKPISRRLANRKRLLDRLETELESASGHQQLRRETETLAAYQARIPVGAGNIELPDIYDPPKRIRFELDPSASIQSQIEKRFKRAAKLMRSDRHIRRRIDEVSDEVRTLTAAVSAVKATGNVARAMRELDRLSSDAATPRAFEAGRPGKKQADRPGAKRFRRFNLDKTWFVLVGRNNKDNDALTFHTASPTDLWFHAQHVAGSHIVLKSHGHPGSPPGYILEKSASIAAYYSKARHSALVPVIYTQRKYVRKPRGAGPGQVLCTREKMIMVEPALPVTEA